MSAKGLGWDTKALAPLKQYFFSIALCSFKFLNQGWGAG